MKNAIILAALLAVVAANTLAQNRQAASAYRSELPQYRFYESAKWRQLVPGQATMAEVRRVLGDPDEAKDIVQYTKPYPGDVVAKQPVFTYSRIMPGWDVLVYFSRYCFRTHAPDPNGDRLCSIDLIPRKRVSFANAQFPSDFVKSHVTAADAAWEEYTAADGLRYEVYSTRTPYGGTLPGDLNRISYGAPDVLPNSSQVPNAPTPPCTLRAAVATDADGRPRWLPSPEMKSRATHKEDVSALLKNADVNAVVVATVLVASSGDVECVKVLNPKHPLVSVNVEKALQDWKFLPMEQSGHAVAYLGWIEFTFCRIGCAEGESKVTLLD